MSENVEKYYLFPNGLQPIDISRYLSGNGAQILQYVARATRTDGKVKGEPIKDLEKAAWFIQDELDRLRAENKAHAEVIVGMQDVRDNVIKPHLVNEVKLEGKEWKALGDEHAIPEGYLLKDSAADLLSHVAYLKQSYDAVYLRYIYDPCNEYGEIGAHQKYPLTSDYIQFPITIVKQTKNGDTSQNKEN